MKNIAIIPARGGSKRFPNKNLAELGNIPLIVHSINYAKENLDIVHRIVVSTDDDKIKNIALEQDIEVIDRPLELSGDKAPTVSALKHVVEKGDHIYDNVFLLQPTNPLRPKELLKEAYQHFINGGFDSLMSVSRSNHKLGKIVDSKFVPFNYSMGQRSQDLEPLFFENGLLYITKSSLIINNRILGDNNCPYIVDHPYAKIDIDTKEDLKLATFFL